MKALTQRGIERAAHYSCTCTLFGRSHADGAVVAAGSKQQAALEKSGATLLQLRGGIRAFFLQKGRGVLVLVRNGAQIVLDCTLFVRNEGLLRLQLAQLYQSCASALSMAVRQ